MIINLNFKVMGKDEKSIYKKSAIRDGVTENKISTQNMQTREKKILEFYGKEVFFSSLHVLSTNFIFRKS